MTPIGQGSAFDTYAADYEAALACGLRLTGEGRQHFAERRVAWLAKRLKEKGISPQFVVDFGCGDGATLPILAERLQPARLVGLEPSTACLAQAVSNVQGRWPILAPERFTEHGHVDLIYCNGVMHHIKPVDRAGMLGLLREMLAPGGLLALWENNPWNPGTQWVMRRIPFDRDAMPITGPSAHSLLERCGFSMVAMDYLFLFPRQLRWLRGLEAPLCRWPLGGQYLALVQRIK